MDVPIWIYLRSFVRNVKDNTDINTSVRMGSVLVSSVKPYYYLYCLSSIFANGKTFLRSGNIFINTNQFNVNNIKVHATVNAESCSPHGDVRTQCKLTQCASTSTLFCDHEKCTCRLPAFGEFLSITTYTAC